MATFRPAIKDNDGYIQKIIKYIPAEIIAGYTALAGYLAVGANADIPAHYKSYYLIVLLLLAIITPVWTFYAVIETPAALLSNPDRKKAYFHAVIATLAFLVWVYATGNPLLKAVLCNCPRTDCADCGGY